MEYEEKEIKQQKNNKKFKEKLYQLIINKLVHIKISRLKIESNTSIDV